MTTDKKLDCKTLLEKQFSLWQWVLNNNEQDYPRNQSDTSENFKAIFGK